MQSPGNTDPLALSTGKFVGVAFDEKRIQAYQVSSSCTRSKRSLAVPILWISSGSPMISPIVIGDERSVRVLEDDLHIAPQLAEIALSHGGEVFAFKKNLPRSGFVELQDGPARSGFAAAAFTHQTHGLTVFDIKVYAVYSLDGAYLTLDNHALGDGKCLTRFSTRNNALFSAIILTPRS